MIFRKCHPEHVLLVQAQPAQQQGQIDTIATGTHYDVTGAGVSFSGWVDNRCLAVAGVFPISNGRGMSWAVLSEAAGAHMTAITRQTIGVLNAVPYKRVELISEYGFEAGTRWARILGFQLEAERMRCYSADGRDMMLWARVRD